MQRKVIAIFGGSFNPPINSHISLARQILKKCKKIEKIIFVPVSTKYQKQNLIEDKHRYNMLKIICNKETKLEVSDVELTSKVQLYTIQTLDLFKQKYKEYDIYFIMGTDNLKELETWSKAEKLLKDYKIIVLERENDNLNELIEKNEFLKNYKNSLIKIDGIDKIFLSSTMIRDKIKKGENIQKFIDSDVLEYIKKYELYI